MVLASVTVKIEDTSPSLLEMTAIDKRYGGVRALSGANFLMPKRGAIYALVGENGSGKSTLLGVLSGQTTPDAGRITIDGQEVAFASTHDAVERGIAMVSQENALALGLSVAENVLLGRRLIRGTTGIDWRETNDAAEKILNRLGLACDPTTRVRDLRPDQRQLVEIARAVSMNARLLILDEPTSSLTDDEVRALIVTMRRLTGDGVAIVFVSHRIPEVLEVADYITVLRDGRSVAHGQASEFDGASIVDAMVGRTHNPYQRPPGHDSDPQHLAGDERLRVDSLTSAGVVSDVSLQVRRGEIVGLAGLVGAGRSELLEAIFGDRPVDAGTICVDGTRASIREPRDAIKLGIGYVPPDRKTQGLVLGRSVRHNLTIVLTLLRRRLVPIRDAEDGLQVQEAITRLRIPLRSLDGPVGSLSGGNQQKVALAKWLLGGAQILLLDEPTRGVDVGAKVEIYELLRGAADDGFAILVSSSENDELLAICDRILVMFRGEVTAEISGPDGTEVEIARLTGGHA